VGEGDLITLHHIGGRVRAGAARIGDRAQRDRHRQDRKSVGQGRRGGLGRRRGIGGKRAGGVGGVAAGVVGGVDGACCSGGGGGGGGVGRVGDVVGGLLALAVALARDDAGVGGDAGGERDRSSDEGSSDVVGEGDLITLHHIGGRVRAGAARIGDRAQRDRHR